MFYKYLKYVNCFKYNFCKNTLLSRIPYDVIRNNMNGKKVITNIALSSNTVNDCTAILFPQIQRISGPPSSHLFNVVARLPAIFLDQLVEQLLVDQRVHVLRHLVQEEPLAVVHPVDERLHLDPGAGVVLAEQDPLAETLVDDGRNAEQQAGEAQ